MIIEFGEWLPDQPIINNPGVVTASGVYPAAKGYVAAAATKAIASSINGAPETLGGFWTTFSGSNRVFMGQAQNLYEISTGVGATASNVSKSAGAYSIATGDNWEFTKFGDFLLATGNAAATADGGDPIQVNDLSATSAFVDAAAGSPHAKHIATVRDFVVVGNTWDASDGVKESRVRWPGIGDHTAWTVSATTQADYEDLQTGGAVQRILGGEYGIIVQEHSVRRMTYVGSPLVWQFDEILPNIGTPAPRSVAQWGDLIFLLATDGFRVIKNGAESVEIGAEKVDRYFWRRVKESAIYKTTAAIDPRNSRVYWAYVDDDAGGLIPNKILVYAWNLGKWSELSIITNYLWTADVQDTVPEVMYADSGNAFRVFPSVYTAGQTGTIKTSFIEPNPRGHSMITRVSTLSSMAATADSSNSVKINHRRDMGLNAGIAEAQVSFGFQTGHGTYTGRANNRFHQIEFGVAQQNDPTTAFYGVEVDWIFSGGRR